MGGILYNKFDSSYSLGWVDICNNFVTSISINIDSRECKWKARIYFLLESYNHPDHTNTLKVTWTCSFFARTIFPLTFFSSKVPKSHVLHYALID